MARLQWEQVRAPELNTRDIALAGQQVSAGFDRLASMFQERALRQKQEATDQAVAGILAQTDPNALTKLDPNSFGKNVNTREVLEAANQQRRGLLVEADTREDLLNKQAMSQYGDELTGLFEAYYNGDEAAKAQIATRSAEDPMFARAAGAYTEELYNAMRAGVQDRFDVTKHQDNLAIDKGNLALRGQELNLSRKDRQDTEAGMNLGLQLAEKYRTLDPADARQAMLEDSLYREASPRARLGIEAVFERNQGILSTPSGEAIASMSPILGQNAALKAELTAAANRAENQQLSPELSAVRLAREYEGKATANEVVELMSAASWTESGARGDLNQILTGVDGATPADVKAAIETFGYGDEWGAGEDNALLARVERIVADRKKGYGQNAEVDIANARGPYESAASALTRAEIRYQRELDSGDGTISPATLKALRDAQERVRKLRER